MIFDYTSDESENSKSSVIYINSYTSSNFMESYYNSKSNSKDVSCVNSRDNSLKSQHFMDNIHKTNNIKEDIMIMKNKLKKKNKIALQLQRKNFKLKYKLVLQELKTQELKNSLYKMNYRLILEQLKNRELTRYYHLGFIYERFLKALE